MKNLLFFFIFITLIACNKDEVVIYKASGDIQYGSFTACKNGKAFEGGCYALPNKYLPNNLFFGVSTVSQDSSLRESISVSVPWKLGEHKMVSKGFEAGYSGPDCSYNTLAQDGDVAEYRYKICNSRKSIINVTKLDTVNNSIEGTFDLYFERDGKKNAEKPRKVCFENGKFKMQYRK